jgi:small-conductance mechanosensitive channel
MNGLDHILLGNTVSQWLLAAAAFIVTFTVLPSLRWYVIRKTRSVAADVVPEWSDLLLVLIRATRKFFLLALAVNVGARLLELSAGQSRVLTFIIVVAFWLQVALWGVTAAEFYFKRRAAQSAAAGGGRQAGTYGVILFIARLGIFVIAGLLALDNLGVNITALVAGLGIGGIAIALAVQTILGDLLASLSITLDKPFEVGDWLRLDDIDGTVEYIGVKSTRLRSLSGEQIILANADILKGRLRNFGRMPERRELAKLGVTYETPPEKLAQLPQIVREAIESVPDTRFAFCVFRNFGDFSLNHEVAYYVINPSDVPFKFLTTVDQVNRRIHLAFNAHGLNFAYPTQTVRLSSNAESPPTP